MTTGIRLSPKEKRGFLKALGHNAGEKFLALLPKLNLAAAIAWTVGAEDTNVCLVTVQVKNENNDNLGTKIGLRFYLSSNAAGTTPAVVTSAAAAGSSGGVTDASTGGGILITTAAGLGIISLTDTTANLTRYVNVILPSGEIVTSPPIVWGTGS
jgi:hypothetical protein